MPKGVGYDGKRITPKKTKKPNIYTKLFGHLHKKDEAIKDLTNDKKKRQVMAVIYCQKCDCIYVEDPARPGCPCCGHK